MSPEVVSFPELMHYAPWAIGIRGGLLFVTECVTCWSGHCQLSTLLSPNPFSWPRFDSGPIGCQRGLEQHCCFRMAADQSGTVDLTTA
jgi:hypothetical protein